MSCGGEKPKRPLITTIIFLVVLAIVLAAIAVLYISRSGERSAESNLSVVSEQSLLIDSAKTFNHGVVLTNSEDRCFNGEVTFSYRSNGSEHRATSYNVRVRKGELVSVRLNVLDNDPGLLDIRIIGQNNHAPLAPGMC